MGNGTVGAVESYRKMAMNSMDKFDAKITHLIQLPGAIKGHLKGDDEDEE